MELTEMEFAIPNYVLEVKFIALLPFRNYELVAKMRIFSSSMNSNYFSLFYIVL